MASPGPMERTRESIVNVEAAAMLDRLAARGEVPLRRGWRRDRLAMRTPVISHDVASDDQAGGAA